MSVSGQASMSRTLEHLSAGAALLAAVSAAHLTYAIADGCNAGPAPSRFSDTGAAPGPYRRLGALRGWVGQAHTGDCGPAMHDDCGTGALMHGVMLGLLLLQAHVSLTCAGHAASVLKLLRGHGQLIRHDEIDTAALSSAHATS